MKQSEMMEQLTMAVLDAMIDTRKHFYVTRQEAEAHT